MIDFQFNSDYSTDLKQYNILVNLSLSLLPLDFHIAIPFQSNLGKQVSGKNK